MDTELIFNENIGLAYSLAGKYQSTASQRGIHYDDITQTALISLWEVIPRWDKTKGSLAAIFYVNGHKKMQRFINSKQHYDSHHLEKKPSGNSFFYVRTPNSTTLDKQDDDTKRAIHNRNLIEAVISKPNTIVEDLSSMEVIETLMNCEWDVGRTAAFLGAIEGYTINELGQQLNTSRQSAHLWVKWTTEMLKEKIRIGTE